MFRRFQSNPLLKTVSAPEGWQGTPLDEKGRFVNLNPAYLNTLADVFRWKFQRNPYSEEKKAEIWDPEIYTDDYWTTGSDDVIVWIGHSTFYIRINGVQLLTDPVFFDIPPVKRHSKLPVDPARFVNIDCILLSHDHRDHLDKKSLKLLSEQYPAAWYLSGLGMKKLIHSFTRSDKIEEAGWYQQYNSYSHSLTITFIPEQHWSKRGLFDTNKRLWGGFVIEAAGKRILFGGDSAYASHYTELASVFGKIDYAILGIGAYEPSWFMSSNHQSPREALKAFTEIGAALFIPMHYGTFDLSDEPLSRPLKDLHAAAASQKFEGELKILTIGKPLVIS